VVRDDLRVAWIGFDRVVELLSVFQRREQALFIQKACHLAYLVDCVIAVVEDGKEDVLRQPCPN
jgi:hypothetical protein